VLATLTLPAGAYVLSAKLTISHWTSGVDTPTSYCYLRNGGQLLDASATDTNQTMVNVSSALEAAVTLGVSSALTLTCNNNNGKTAAQNWRFGAIRVGALH
jgi:hypothetical protein